MSFRKVIFWSHLVIGLTAGLVIAMSAFTGATMAFEKQIIAWCERDQRFLTSPATTSRWSLQLLVENLREEYPDARPQSIEVSSDPNAVVVISLGRTNVVYVNPYTGDFQPQGAPKARAFFELMLRWHRWLGVAAPPQPDGARQTAAPPATASTNAPNAATEPPRPAGGWREFTSTVVGVSCCIFLALSLSGLYLWWPRQWTALALRSITLLSFNLRGKPRDWNWHNAIGFWSSPILILTTVTGIVISFHAVADWIYKRPENETAGLKISTPEPDTRPLDPDALLAAAQKEVPNWKTITLRLAPRRQRGAGGGGMQQRPQPENREAATVAANVVASINAQPTDSPKPNQASETRPATSPSPLNGERAGVRGGQSEGRQSENRGASGNRTPQPISVSVVETGSWSPVPVQLQLDPYTGAVLRADRLSDFGFRRAIRTLNKSLHTGEAGGIVHQTLSLLACLGALVLVWTGFALTWRRFLGRNNKNKDSTP